MNFPRPHGWLLWVLMPLAAGSAWAAAPEPPLPPPLTPRTIRPGVVGTVKPTNGTALVVPLTNRPPAHPAMPVANPPAGKPGIFTFDATSKQVEVAEGERTAVFVFAVTNISPDEVTISYVNTSCGCTAGRLPAYPWKLKPGEGGHIDVTMDVTGKFGLVTKTATVVSSAGSYPLTVSSKMPLASATPQGDRSRNMQVAQADRQAVFRNDCANCHVQPAIGKTGKELYESACGICHEAEHRAQMVPDLRLRLKNTDRNYWAKWIGEGKAGGLMPAFSAKQGGILSDVQIESLVAYLEDDYKKNPLPSKTAAHAAAVTTPAAGASKVADR